MNAEPVVIGHRRAGYDRPAVSIFGPLDRNCRSQQMSPEKERKDKNYNQEKLVSE